MDGHVHQASKPAAPAVTLAERLLAAGGQRLRADETVNWLTFLVNSKARWVAGREVARG